MEILLKSDLKFKGAILEQHYIGKNFGEVEQYGAVSRTKQAFIRKGKYGTIY